MLAIYQAHRRISIDIPAMPIRKPTEEDLGQCFFYFNDYCGLLFLLRKAVGGIWRGFVDYFITGQYIFTGQYIYM